MRLASNKTRSISAGDVWFISLGDLLTLLVCFFLVLTPHKSTSSNAAQTKQGVIGSQGVKDDVGTVLAQSPLGQFPSVADARAFSPIAIWSDDVQLADKSADNRESERSWSAELLTAVVAGEMALVKLCDSKLEREILAQFGSVIERDLARSSAVSFETGANCETWRALRRDNQTLVAVVSFSKK